MEIAPDIWQDEFGVQWDRRVDKDIGVVCNRLVTPDNVVGFAFPDPDDPARYDFFDDAIAANRDTAVLMSLGFSLFERAWTLAGMENVMMAMVADKGFANKLKTPYIERKY